MPTIDPPPYRSIAAEVVYQDGSIAVIRTVVREGGRKREEYRVSCAAGTAVRLGEAGTTDSDEPDGPAVPDPEAGA